MAQTSFPFENVDTTEVQFSQWARHINEGIRPDFANELEVFADDSGLNVKVKSGQAMVRGHYYDSTAEETLTITTPDATNPRIDSVVLELDIVANSILLTVVAGTPDASPVAPTLTQSEDGNVYQLLLANVDVGAGVFSIEAGDVTDLRNLMSAPVNDIITTEGDLIVGDGNGKATRLPVGSADQVLTSDGTTVSFQDAGGGGELYAAGSHTVSKDAGYYLIDTFGQGPFETENQTLVDGINNLDSFNSLIVSFENGTSWIDRTFSNFGNFDFEAITFGDGLFVAVGGSSIYISTDGINWSFKSGATNLRAVTYGDGLFVAVGGSGELITSTDGNSFSVQSSISNSTFYGVTFGDGLYVAVGSNGSLYTSSDGISWTSQTSGTSAQLEDVTYGDGLYVAVGRGGEIISSSNGISWTSQTSGTSENLIDVVYGDGLFVAVGWDATILTSSDGVNWTSQTALGDVRLYGVTYGNGLYVVVGAGNGDAFSSPDAITWTFRDTEVNENLNDVTFGNNLFCAVGEEGAVGTSLNGTAGGVLLLTELQNPIQP